MTMYFIYLFLFNFHATYIKYYHVNLIASRTDPDPQKKKKLENIKNNFIKIKKLLLNSQTF
jgi:hypothetical protein